MPEEITVPVEVVPEAGTVVETPEVETPAEAVSEEKLETQSD